MRRGPMHCVALFACALAGGCGAGQSVPTPDGQTPGTAFQAEAVAQEARTGAHGLRHKGRTVSLAGRVGALARHPGPGGALVVSLIGLPPAPPMYPEGTPVKCAVRAEDEGRVVDLSVGQEVTVRGRVADLSPWVVELDGCAVEAVGPDPVAPVPMAEVADEFKKDPAAAERKYAGRPLTLTGAVVESKDAGRRRLRIVSEIGNPNFGGLYAVWNLPNSVDGPRFDAVKAGDRVNIKCRFGVQVGGYDLVFCDCRLVP